MADLAELNLKVDSSSVRRATGDLKKFGSGAKGASAAAQNFKIAALAMTAVVVGLSAASVKMALDFDKSMRKVTSLVGVARSQVNAWRSDLLDMAGEVGASPQALADGLFFVTSAGFRGAAALDVLKISAQAAASGLGEVESVADGVTSAINGYGAANLTAAKAAGILVATVREGKASAEDITPVIGAVIPVAAELGVTFDQVGASIAALTRLGLNAAESSTALRSILNTLLKPSAKAEETLQKIGTSAAELRKQVGAEGLLPVLFRLKDAFDGDSAAMAEVFENTRALTGVLALTGKSADNTRAIFAALANETGGALADAFRETAEGPGFKMKQAMTEIQALMIRWGDEILPMLIPIIEDLTEKISSLANWFSNLEPETRKNVVQLALIGPPLLALAATLAQVAIGANAAIGLASAAGVGTGLAGLGGVLLALGPFGWAAIAMLAAAAAAIVYLESTATDATPEIEKLARVVADTGDECHSASNEVRQLANYYGIMAAAAKDAETEAKRLADTLSDEIFLGLKTQSGEYTVAGIARLLGFDPNMPTTKAPPRRDTTIEDQLWLGDVDATQGPLAGAGGGVSGFDFFSDPQSTAGMERYSDMLDDLKFKVETLDLSEEDQRRATAMRAYEEAILDAQAAQHLGTDALTENIIKTYERNKALDEYGSMLDKVAAKLKAVDAAEKQIAAQKSYAQTLADLQFAASLGGKSQAERDLLAFQRSQEAGVMAAFGQDTQAAADAMQRLTEAFREKQRIEKADADAAMISEQLRDAAAKGLKQSSESAEMDAFIMNVGRGIEDAMTNGIMAALNSGDWKQSLSQSLFAIANSALRSALSMMMGGGGGDSSTNTWLQIGQWIATAVSGSGGDAVDGTNFTDTTGSGTGTVPEGAIRLGSKSSTPGDIYVFNVPDEATADMMAAKMSSSGSTGVVAKGSGSPGISAGHVRSGRR